MANATKKLITANLTKLRQRVERELPHAGGHLAGIRSAIASVNATQVPDDIDTATIAATAVAAERVAIIDGLKSKLDKPYKSGTRSMYDAEAEENRHLGHEDGVEEAIYLIQDRQALTST